MVERVGREARLAFAVPKVAGLGSKVAFHGAQSRAATSEISSNGGPAVAGLETTRNN